MATHEPKAYALRYSPPPHRVARPRGRARSPIWRTVDQAYIMIYATTYQLPVKTGEDLWSTALSESCQVPASHERGPRGA